MQTVSQVMTRNARWVAPGESLQRAAQLMDELDVGALPVCEGERLVGMVTDRDIAVRGIAAGKAPQTSHVDEVMSADVRACFEDQSVDEVMAQMGDSQIRRVPVVSHENPPRLIGIVALADLAVKADGAGDRVEQVVEQVSTLSGAAAQGAGQAGSGGARVTPMVKEAGVEVGSQGGTDPAAPTGMKNGVPEALTGLDERIPGTRLEEVGVSGQQRIDNSGEPLRNPGSHDPADNASLQQDVDGRKPPSKPSNAV
jgi:CBS domain-containing protein